jgi:hypothetical protein
MELAPVREKEDKKGTGGAGGSGKWEDTLALAKVYSWFFARAGFLTV